MDFHGLLKDPIILIEQLKQGLHFPGFWPPGLNSGLQLIRKTSDFQGFPQDTIILIEQTNRVCLFQVPENLPAHNAR